MTRLPILFLLLSLVAVFPACDDDGGGTVVPAEVPRMSINNVTQPEGDEGETLFRFKVSLSNPYDKTVTFNFATEEISAQAGTDFVAQSGSISIAADQTEAFIDIVVLTDTLREEDEQFAVRLSNIQNATALSDRAIGTIRNEDTFVFVPEDGYITPTSYAGHTLVWADEFDGSSIDADNWTFEIGAGGWGNQELQYYTARPENAFVSNGKLFIVARQENYQGAGYTSARMITSDKQEFFPNCRIDIRAQLPKGQGMWPALWMLGANFWDIGWPACGEIDIMELVGHEPRKVHGSAHWGPQGQGFSNSTTGSYSLPNSGPDFSERFHVFSIRWDYNSVRYFVDDIQYFQINGSTVGSNAYPFNDPFFFIFNIAVGGVWPGSPNATTQFPQQMVVDYVRVFQQN